MKTNYAGIDYGMGQSNIDEKTGIRYGVISQNEVLQAWADSSEPEYVYMCPHCEEELEVGSEEICPHCGYEFNDYEFQDLEPISFYIDNGEYKAACATDGDIFITKSPYFTFAQFCSPCAPGAGYLMNPFVREWENYGTGQKGIMNPEEYPEDYKERAAHYGFPRVYCFGHDWFENGKAPYPVFSVETGELVLPTE